jgi:outer membrane protein assembly factor BamB
MTMKFAPILFASILLSAQVRAANWPQWRGPNFNGSSDEKGLPEKFSKESAVWTLDLPGPSASTPVIWEDRIFVSTPDEKTKTLQCLCVDRKTGKVLWDKTVGEGMISRDEKSNFAAPSPVADKDKVFFFFSDGPLIAFDHAGKELWKRNITKDYGDFAFQWTFSSSPTLYNGKLYLQILQRDVPVHGKGKQNGESFLLGLDPNSGKTIWQIPRPNEAVAESKESYATPIPNEWDGRREVLVAGGDCLTGHDPDSGKELWRWGTWNPNKISHWRLVPTPVAGGGVVLACAPKGDPVYAIKLGGNGTLNDSAIAWKSSEHREVSSDVPTPAFYDGDFFILGDGKRTLSRVEPATGKIKWSAEVPGRKKLEASPTVADGKVYFMNFGGELTVFDANKGELLATIPMGEPGDNETRSSVAVAHGQLFVRTNHKLFCIAQK